MKNSKIMNYKFRGGVWIGAWATSWPFCTIEINQDSLSIHDEMLKRDLVFAKGDGSHVEIKKYFPVIGYGIRVYHNKSDYDDIVYFWYVSFRFKRLVEALKKCGWL